MESGSEALDQAAMRRLHDGEELALNEIMERWKRPLTHYLFRLLGREHEAVDLAQETFVRVYEQRQRYRPDGKFSVWLFTIATNLYRNQIRWKIRHPQISLGEMVENPTDGTPSPADQMMEQEQRRFVQRAIAVLPWDLKTALLLFEFEDQSYDDIAAVMRCTRKAVEMKLYRARQILREKLQPSGARG